VDFETLTILFKACGRIMRWFIRAASSMSADVVTTVLVAARSTINNAKAFVALKSNKETKAALAGLYATVHKASTVFSTLLPLHGVML
jgi:hypothetical protein